ncbi:MAG: hypothetical protein R3A79_26785 [Nannocystaceae bacterium]
MTSRYLDRPPLHRILTFGGVMSLGCAGGGSGSSESSTSSDASTTDASASSTTADIDATTDTDASTGDPPADACPDDDDYDCSEPPQCAYPGVGVSRRDENCCNRPSGATGCPEGWALYSPQEFGGCSPSHIQCTEENNICECFATEDCNGSWCVPEDALDDALDGPARIEGRCLDRMDVLRLTIGLAASTCDASVGVAPWLELDITGGAPLEPGSYAIQGARYDMDGDGAVDVEQAPYFDYASITIDSWDQDLVAGSYLIHIGAYHLSGTFAEAPYCAVDPCP